MDPTANGADGPAGPPGGDRPAGPDAPPRPVPGHQPPGRSTRHLDRAPGERYARTPGRGATDGPGGVLPGGSMSRALLVAIPAAIFALAAYVGIAGPLSISEGLVVVAILAGSLIGRSVKTGAGAAVDRRRRVRIALTITGAWFVLAQVGTWQFALSEGGVLPILDYLGQTFGLIVPLVAIAAAVAAWWSAR